MIGGTMGSFVRGGWLLLPTKTNQRFISPEHGLLIGLKRYQHCKS